MITLLAATLLAVQFPGGAPNEFVGALAKGANRSVVLALSAAHTIPKADFEIDDFDLMARSIRKQTQLAILPGIDLVLSDQLLPKRLVTEVVYRGGGQSESDQLEIESKIAEIRASKLPTSPTASSDLPINFVDLHDHVRHREIRRASSAKAKRPPLKARQISLDLPRDSDLCSSKRHA